MLPLRMKSTFSSRPAEPDRSGPRRTKLSSSSAARQTALPCLGGLSAHRRDPFQGICHPCLPTGRDSERKGKDRERFGVLRVPAAAFPSRLLLRGKYAGAATGSAQVPRNVLRQFGDGSVSFIRLLAESLHYYVVQVRLKLGRERSFDCRFPGLQEIALLIHVMRHRVSRVP